MLVMIPGWAMHRGVWSDWAQSLSKFFQVTMVDLPGHGSSAPWQKMTLENIAQSLASSVDGKVIWLGWSLGGLIALQLARQYPQSTAGIVLVSSNACFLQKQDWPGVSTSWFNQFREALRGDAGAALKRFIGMVAGGKSQTRKLRALWHQYSAPPLETLLQGLDILAFTDGREALKGLHCPVTLMVGDDDPLIPVAAIHSMSGLVPNCRTLTLNDAGHAPFLTHSQQMTQALIQ